LKKVNFRKGWTVIELIFVIVIIGILAATILPKMAATRDDALLSTDVYNMAICIKDASTSYTATKVDFTEENNSLACESVICYDIHYAVKGQDFNVTTNPEAAAFCKDIEYMGGHLAKSYNFGGSRIKE
jgi:prepilin-type N-terminal cleavage/methylation domain-containing protein